MSTAPVPEMRAQMQEGGDGRDAGNDGGTAGSGWKMTAAQQEKRQRGGTLQRRGTGGRRDGPRAITTGNVERRKTAGDRRESGSAGQPACGGERTDSERHRATAQDGRTAEKRSSADRKTQRGSEGPLATAAGDSRRRRGNWQRRQKTGTRRKKGRETDRAGRAVCGRETPDSGGETAGRSLPSPWT